MASSLLPPSPPPTLTHTHLLTRGPAVQTLQPDLSCPPSCLGNGSLTLWLGSSLWGPQAAFFRERPALTRLGHFRPVSPPSLPPSILLPPPEPVTWAQGAAMQSSGACRLSLTPTRPDVCPSWAALDSGAFEPSPRALSSAGSHLLVQPLLQDASGRGGPGAGVVTICPGHLPLGQWAEPGSLPRPRWREPLTVGSHHWGAGAGSGAEEEGAQEVIGGGQRSWGVGGPDEGRLDVRVGGVWGWRPGGDDGE